MLAGAIAWGMPAERTLDAGDFGLHADGATDDGPALRRMVEAAHAIDGPVTLRFPPQARIFVATGTEKYALRLDRQDQLTMEGQGSTFLLAEGELRFLHATTCRDLRVRNLKVDVTPPPVVESRILEVLDSRTLRVALDDPAQVDRVGGPSREKDEQTFFGMLWLSGRHAMESEHVYVEWVSAASERERGRGVVQVRLSEPVPDTRLRQIVPGQTRLSLPVPGVAHRYGGSSMIRIDRCDGVEMEEVEVGSAPWFAFEIFRNAGDLVFRRVHIRPPPDSGRVTSSWRDGFHVKGNRGRLLFEACILKGMNDDSFNISTHTWRVVDVLDARRVRIRQEFPIQFIPPQVGGEAQFLCPTGERLLGTVRIDRVEGMPSDDAVYLPGNRKAPELTLHLDYEVEGIGPGALVWDVSVANPDTTIRNCYLGNSARFRSPVTLEHCESDALLLFTAEEVEGPMPSGSVVRHSILRQGRGNRRYAVVFNGWKDRHAGRVAEDLPPGEDYPLHSVRMEHNEIYGGVLIDKVRDATLIGNRLHDGPDAVRVFNSP